VNYEARNCGVKRGMRGDQAKAICPEFHAFFVQEKRGKANLTKYRDASLKIFDVITSHCEFVEKASIDEAYLDLTEKVTERIRNNQTKNVDVNDLNDSFVVGSYTINNDQGFNFLRTNLMYNTFL
jgi:DNA polymerase eta